jgi:regulator of replication initiation timing
MHIELLWIIPIISFAIFLFIVAYQAQKAAERKSKTAVLSTEVALFNAGQEVPGVSKNERNFDRLQDLEKAINLVTEVLSRQARETPSGTADTQNPGSDDVNELKEKLRSVFKEYDIILSENYTLRAKVKQLSRLIKEKEEPSEVPEFPQNPLTTEARDGGAPSGNAMHLYDDTRLINLITLTEERKIEPLNEKSAS